MRQQMVVESWIPAIDGELNEAKMRHKLEGLGYQVTRYVYPPGTRFPAHSRAVEKIDGVLTARLRMAIQGRSVILTAGDCLRLPKGCGAQR